MTEPRILAWVQFVSLPLRPNPAFCPLGAGYFFSDVRRAEREARLWCLYSAKTKILFVVHLQFPYAAELPSGNIEKALLCRRSLISDVHTLRVYCT
jgi:hypothetical protein